MPTVRCDCGARYEFTEEQTGRRVQCRQCGTWLILFSDNLVPIPLAHMDPPEGSTPREYAAEELESGTVVSSEAVPAWEHRAEDSPPLIAPPTPVRGYLESLLNAVLFPVIPENLIALFVLWFFVGILLPALSRFWALWIPWAIAAILVHVWYSWYQFAVVESAAGGEQRLPALANAEIDSWELVAPLFKWLVSWGVVAAPAALYVLLAAHMGEPIPEDAIRALFSGLTGLPAAFKADPMLVGLVVLGVMFWPIVLLCLVVEGFRAVWRVDLMAVTIFRSFEAYAVTLAVVALSFLLMPLGMQWAQVAAAGATNAGNFGAGQYYFLSTALELFHIYLRLVALQVVGLHYRHYKHNFAFDWGQ